MKLIYTFTLPLLLLCSEAHSETLESLIDFLSANGTNKLIEHIELTASENENQGYLDLENELLQMGSQELITPTPKWKVDRLSAGKGIELSLGIGRYYFKNNPTSTLELEACASNLTSSGMAHITLENGTIFNFGWSCGSLGCSYTAKLGEAFSPCS